ncbi:glutathione S-transferase family protein [Phaeovulum vinaykumarii]|uniref:Glutathione S-transferase n=1 Tax=Phaeovulum vinaykumarii TaxID=407234 RepID=A0A1N7LKU3_9RHOB|nr:glutathione S-transferase family protein [Phaeovulum vinaykumarii]SIS74443.1 glutathione S-transferase [Phaeovulum vinaykumarii]SOC05030.1 glutathione S-transferase [Phaeovulum vinaykumarii]
MIRILGVARSRATRNIWLLEELGAEWQLVPVIQAYRLPDPLAPDAPLNTRSPAFLDISPQGAVPVMQDGDFTLTESLAINLYLARRFGGPLAPETPQEDALAAQWSLYGATAIEGPALEISFAYRDDSHATPEGAARIDRAMAALERPLRVLESHLSTRDWLMGERFTVADINLSEMVRYAQAHGPALAPYPAVSRWLAACHARPAFARMWEMRLAEPE